MSKIDDQLVSIYASHSVYLNRLGAQFGNDVQPYLANIENRIYGILNGFRANKAITTQVRQDVQKQINAITREELQAYTTQYKLDNKEMGVNDVAFHANTLNTLAVNYTATVPTAVAVNHLVVTTPLKIGDDLYTTYNRYVDNYHKQYTAKVDDIVRAGFLAGQTMREVSNAIEEQLPTTLTSASKSAKQMARTGTNFYANQATIAFVDKNEEVLSGYQFLATLDSRVSRQCASLDGNKYPKNYSNMPTPPLHPNCRSQLIYDVDERYKFIESSTRRPSNFTDSEGVRKPKGVSSAQTYYDELSGMVTAKKGTALYKKQIADQNLLLGSPTLGDAFRKMDKNGDIDLFRKQLIDSTYQPISLRELKEKNNELGRILRGLNG